MKVLKNNLNIIINKLKNYSPEYIQNEHNHRNVLDVLIATKLSQNTTDKTAYIAYKNLKNDLNFHVIVGPLFNYSEDLKRLANNDKRIKIFKQPGNIIELMEKSDLAITAAE